MPLDLRVIEDKVKANLTQASITTTSVRVEQLSGQTYVVTIVSDSFEGQTFLDREMRVRPAVARAFSIAGAPRAEFVIEPITPAESPEGDVSLSVGEISGTHLLDDDARQGKAEWKRDVQLVLDALKASHYTISVITDQRAYIAERTQLSSEKIVVGFAPSPRSSTVDIDVRAQIQAARTSQRIAASYYISSEQLEQPFSNQTRAPWLQLHTVSSFLHVLNSSKDLANRLIEEVDQNFDRVAPEHRGRVIEPDIRISDDTTRPNEFFDYIDTWRRGSDPSLLVIMAPAGHGKTTLSLELARRMAAAHLAAANSPVPLVVPFESVRRTVDFESLLYRRLGELRPGAVGAYQALLERGDAVLIVDGFDELADDAGFDVASAQIRSMKFLFKGKTKIILAGRSVFTQGFAGEDTVAGKARSLLGNILVDVIELMPFDEGNVEEYVNTRDGLAAQQRKAVLDYCDYSPDHHALASNPLFLKFLCSLAVSERLPNARASTSGVDALLERVCEREEERQQLGISIAAQWEFLHSLALEIFATGRPLLRDDVGVLAELVASTASPGHEKELRGKLIDHALLRLSTDHRIDFIHPLVRDVVLGTAFDKLLREERWSELGRKDLPEGTVSHLAGRVAESPLALPPKWLTTSSAQLGPFVRRNLFRIATKAANRRASGNPRGWRNESWSDGRRIRGLDLSGLTFQSLSFDDIEFDSCDLSQTMFDDCDFRSSLLDACTVRSSLFLDCRARAVARGGVVLDVVVASGNSASIVSGPDKLTAALKGQPDAMFHDEPPTDVNAKINELARIFLLQLVDVDPQPRFHTVPENELINVGGTDREIAAVNKVIQPRLVNRLCSVTLHGGSQRRIAIDQRFRAAVVEFLRTGAQSKALKTVFGTMPARAARFFT